MPRFAPGHTLRADRGENKTGENKMSYFNRRYYVARVRGMFGALVLASAMGAAYGQNLTKPATPALITPPDGHALFLIAPADGTQGYICLPTGPGAATVSWTVKSSRPQATLF